MWPQPLPRTGHILHSSKGFFCIITHASESTLKLPVLGWRKLEKWDGDQSAVRVCLERQRLRETVLLTFCVTLGKLLTLSGPDISFLYKGRPCHDWRAGLENSNGYRGPQGHPHEEGGPGKGAAKGQSTGPPHSASPTLPGVNSRGVQETKVLDPGLSALPVFQEKTEIQISVSSLDFKC